MILNKKLFITLMVIILVNILLVMLFVGYIKWNDVDSGLSLRKLSDKLNPNGNSSQMKSILFWNGARRSEMTIFGTGHDAFAQHGCPVSDCEIVNSMYQYPERPLDAFDAIIFNFNDEFWLTKRPDFQRQPHQRFIFFTVEPPPSNEPMVMTGYANYFNWTMTYRLDSDVRLRFGQIRPKISAPTTSEQIQARIKRTHSKLSYNNHNKTLVAAMISHCSTDGRREHYIKRLKKHFKVDVYGFCDEEDDLGSGLHCAPHELLPSTNECYDILESNYKFYLSFENAICTDYVTEKFFHIMGRRNIVPIVYGGADYARLAPQHSYINAMEFEPDQLAEYLKMLDANDTLYNEYLWWKDDYIVESDLRQMVRHGFCDLRQKLHQDQGRTKYYPSLLPEWDPARCYRPRYKSNNSRTKKGRNETTALPERLSWNLGQSHDKKSFLFNSADPIKK